MELRVLQYFLAVAREGSITRAAQSLHLTQPTLSRQLAQLEQELGVPLFSRANHTVTLTEEGLLLKRYAQELLALSEKAQQDLRQGKAELSGCIHIGSGEFSSSRALAGLIAAFRQKHPQVRYEIYSGNGENIRDSIDRGLLDLGLITAPVDSQKYEFLPLSTREYWALLVREDDPLAQKAHIAPRDLENRALIFPSNPQVQALLMRWMGSSYRKELVIAKGNLLYNNAALVQQGVGVALTSYFHCHYEGLHYIPLEPELFTETALVWKRDQVYASAAAAFLAFAKEFLHEEEQIL